MCVAIPAKIISVKDSIAEVELLGVVRTISLELVEEARLNDYVLVHAGFAIQIIDEKDAMETLELFKELMQHETA